MLRGVLVFLLLVQAAWVASAASLVNYQGLLTDDLGEPIEGAVGIEFRLFDVETAGAPLWTEFHPAVTVVAGEFSVLLGSLSPLDPGLFEAPDLWLEFEVDGETMAPRQRVTSVPFALRAGCHPGDAVDCYTGPPGTREVGVCSGGRRICDPDGRWGVCSGESVPEAEICGDGIDNDCDGQVDEGCVVCTDADSDGYFAQAGCGTAIDCDDTDSSTNPAAGEICGDGIDNDCDGQVDEGCGG